MLRIHGVPRSRAFLCMGPVEKASWFNGFDASGTPCVEVWLDACLTRPATLAAWALWEA